MPLETGKKAFGRNVKTEIAAGMPQKQALAVAYAKERADALNRNLDFIADSVEQLEKRMDTMSIGGAGGGHPVQVKADADDPTTYAEAALRLVAREFPGKYSAFKAALGGKTMITRSEFLAACKKAGISGGEGLSSSFVWRAAGKKV